MLLTDYVRAAVDLGASDIFIVSGAPVSAKVGGELMNLDGDKLLPPKTMGYITEAYQSAGRSMDRLLDRGDDDFSFACPGLARLRVNTYRQRGSYAMVIRIVSFEIPSWQDLCIPEEVMKLADLKHGLVIVTGTAGSGKSTTQACVINRINETRAAHIVTLEDPIEFLHRDNKSIISQREISLDTQDCLTGLRACLRQSPDVILLGEMRDADTIRATITAAETGHLVMATLHTRGAVNAIDRIIDTFPAGTQQQIRLQLSTVLETVVSQQLVPGKNGERIGAFEILHMTNAVRSMIRDSKTHMINNAISTGSADGMISMDQALMNLYAKGLITLQTAMSYADIPDQMRRKLSL